MTTLVTLALVAALVAVVLGLLALRGPASTTSADATTRQVSAAGTGTATARPDVMRFTVGVDVTRPEVSAAVDDANARMRKVLRTVREQKVADRDIQTERYAIEPRYDYAGDVERLIGYTVTQRARITVRDVEKAGDVISATTRAGGDDVRVEGVAFEVSDPEKMLDAARADAVKQARAHAQVYAEAAGAELGEVIAVVEDGAPAGPDPQVYAARELADAQSVPIEPGSSELEVRVKVTWQLG